MADALAARADFALYLETAGPGPRAEQRRAQVGPATVEGLRARWGSTILGPDVTRRDVERALGRPASAGATEIRYRLPGWDDHIYRFRFAGPGGRLAGSGFVEADDAALRMTGSLGRHERARLLERARASEDLVTATLGPPDRVTGWWPVETWTYQDGLMLTLRHGLLEAFDAPPTSSTHAR